MTAPGAADSLRLVDRSWPDVPAGVTILVPVGSHEQHGPHLPLDTDTVIAVATADAAAADLSARGAVLLVAPALAYGASGEHQPFAGTVSIGHEVLGGVVRELVRSLSTWAARIVLVNGHGGNVRTLREVVRQMRYEQHDVSWVPCAFETATDAHAGHDETSVMLHLASGRVRMDRAAPGNTETLEAILPALMASGVMAVSPSGVLGDPTRASADHGAALFDGLVRDVVRLIESGEVDDSGRLTTARPGRGE